MKLSHNSLNVPLIAIEMGQCYLWLCVRGPTGGGGEGCSCIAPPEKTDRESRLGGLVLMGVPSSELLSSSSDSSDWISSTMDRRGPGRNKDHFKWHLWSFILVSIVIMHCYPADFKIY